MKKISFIFTTLSFLTSMAFAEVPHAKQLVKKEGKGQFVTSTESRQFCTHDKTILAFAESQTSLGLDVVNKSTGETARYFLSSLSYSLNIKGTIFEKAEGSANFTKYILINSSTSYFNSLAEISTAETDAGFMFKRIYDTNKNTSTLYCSKK